MSAVNNIKMSYQEYKSYVKNNKSSKLANRSYHMDMGDAANKESLLGSITITNTDTNTKCEWKAAYDENFTSDMPLVKVTSSDTGGNQQQYVINIDEIDVNDASDVEMFALCSYMDAHEKQTNGVKHSWDALRNYVSENHVKAPSGENGIQKYDWLAMVTEAKNEYIESKQYSQVTDGNQMLYLLEKYGMPKEVEMVRIDENTLVPVSNQIKVQDVDGGYAQILYDNSGEIRYVNHLNKESGWSMGVSQEMLEKAQKLGSEFVPFMADRGFWENYLNGDIDIDKLKEAMDYKTIRKSFLDNLPESVRQAWEHAAEVAGTDGLGVDENAVLQYPSEFMKQYMYAVLKGESTRICGDTAESVLEFAKMALAHLEDGHQPKYNAGIQALKDKEMLFYQNLITNLS